MLCRLMGSDDHLLSRTDVGNLLGVRMNSVRDWEHKGMLPPSKTNARGESLFSWFALRVALRETISNRLFPAFSTCVKPGPAGKQQELK